MIMYYNKYICGDCGAEAHLEDGATYCPYCGGELYKARSGWKKTVAACSTAAKLFAAIAMPSLLAAIVLASPTLFWFTVTSLTLAAGAAINGRREARKHG